tara:strand:- start:1653 stop:2192 length:540 start_codon:yes stop_codon:yes gene_type:complete
MGLFSGKRKSDGSFDMRTSGNKGKSSSVGGRITSGIIGGIFSSMQSSPDTIEEQEKKERNIERQSFYDQKDDDLVNMDIPETEKELVDFMDYLISIIGLHGWSMSQQDEDQRKNALSDSALAKIEMGLFKLNILSSPYHPFYQKKLKSFKRKRIFKKYIIWLLLVFAFLFCYLVVVKPL